MGQYPFALNTSFNINRGQEQSSLQHKAQHWEHFAVKNSKRVITRVMPFMQRPLQLLGIDSAGLRQIWAIGRHFKVPPLYSEILTNHLFISGGDPQGAIAPLAQSPLGRSICVSVRRSLRWDWLLHRRTVIVILFSGGSAVNCCIQFGAVSND